jgi:hypothetical protein
LKIQPQWPLLAVTALAGCSGVPAGGNGGGGGTSSGLPLAFSISTGNYGAVAYTCSPGSGVSPIGGFTVACSLADDGGALSGPIVQIAGYHGTDTYAFQGSNDEAASFVQFGLAGYDFGSAPAWAGLPATTCSVQLTGNATLSRGDHVTGTFHCDGIQGIPVHVTQATPEATVTASVDGRFDGFEML